MGPLAGKRIIEIGGIGPGPFCGMLFADMGAEVILVEKRTLGPNATGSDVDSTFRIMDRGKKSITLDLKQTRAMDVVLRLIEGSDVCFAPVLDFDEAPDHAHNRQRGVFASVAGVTQPAPAPRFSETVSEVSSPPPRPGQHSDAILRMAGYSSAEVAALREQAVI